MFSTSLQQEGTKELLQRRENGRKYREKAETETLRRQRQQKGARGARDEGFFSLWGKEYKNKVNRHHIYLHISSKDSANSQQI